MPNGDIATAAGVCRLARKLADRRELLVTRVEQICDRAEDAGILVVAGVPDAAERAIVEAFSFVDDMERQR